MNTAGRIVLSVWWWWPWVAMLGVGPLLVWFGAPNVATLGVVFSLVAGWGVGTAGGLIRAYRDVEEVIRRDTK